MFLINKGSEFRIYKELLYIDSNMKNNQPKNASNDRKRQYTEEEAHVDNNY